MLPEMFVCPYQKNYMLASAETVQVGQSGSTTANLLSSLAKETSTYIIGGSIPELTEHTDPTKPQKIFNTCLCFNKHGEVVAGHRKQHLFDVDIPGGITFFESNFVNSGPA